MSTQASKTPSKARFTIGLVGCGKAKLDRRARAKNLYIGDLFKKCRAWVERHCDEWAILSAAHHLVLPDTILEPYDVRIPSNEEGARRWARMTNDQVVTRWCKAGFYHREKADDYGGHPVEWDPGRRGVPRFIVLAGVEYRRAFEGPLIDSGYCLRLPIEVPMRGMEIGEQLSWLKNQLAAPQTRSTST